MERTDIDGGSDSQMPGPRSRAEGSTRRPGSSSKGGRARGGTHPAGTTPSDLEARLSILQSAYEQALIDGLKARSVQQTAQDGETPVLTIQIFDVSKCPECQRWNPGTKCPICL